MVERYVVGELSTADAEDFEDHYFACGRCLTQLETVQNVARLLGRPVPIRRISYAGFAMAACLVIAVASGLYWKLQPPGDPPPPAEVARLDVPPAKPWSELGKFDAPAYRETKLRGTANAAGQTFLEGIAAYRRGAYVEAAPLLRKASEANPRDAKAAFFSGVCLVLAGDANGGLDALRRVDELGLTPYQEEARFYLAKALLQQNDAAAAKAALKGVVALHGDWESQAKELLTKLPE